MTQKNELFDLIKWLARRARDHRKDAMFYEPGHDLRYFYFEKYLETLVILRKTVSIYLPVKHDGMQEFTCCECGRKAWSKTWILPDVFRRIDIVCKSCTGTGEVESYFHRREEK